MRIQILILGFKGSTPPEKRTTQSTDFKGVCYIPVHPNIVGNNKTVQKSRKIVDYNLTFVFKSGRKSLCSFHSFIKQKKKYIYIYIYIYIIPSFFLKTIHFCEQHSQYTFALFPSQLGHVDFSLDSSPPLGLFKVVKNVVCAAVQLAKSSDAREIAVATVCFEHALLVGVLSIFSILNSIKNVTLLPYWQL